MIYILSALLALLPDYQIVGPGALGYSQALRAVAERRLQNGWGLESLEPGAVLVAPVDCAHLGRAGWLIAGGAVHRAQVVDCENGDHAGMMESRGLLADVDKLELGHCRGWLILER